MTPADRQAIRDNAEVLLLDRDGERWIEPHEITDSASPELRAARDVLALDVALSETEAELDRRSGLSKETVKLMMADAEAALVAAEKERDGYKNVQQIALAERDALRDELAEARSALGKTDPHESGIIPGRLIGADHLQFKWQARAEAAEAEVARLREALRGMLDSQLLSMPGVNSDGTVSTSSMAETLARAALADKEGT